MDEFVRAKISAKYSDLREMRKICIAKLGAKWLCFSVKHHPKSLAKDVSRPVKQCQDTACNAVTIGQFFAQVQMKYEKFSICDPCQVSNLD